MHIRTKDFHVSPGRKIHLKELPTAVDPVYSSESEYKSLLKKHVERLSELQNMLYASGTHALLLIFQGMDTAGKDGAIRHVMSGVNPQGCRVTSFRQPSDEERKHDFLWRAACHLPEKGMIGIFNRSYYEEVIVVRVHPEELRREKGDETGKGVWDARYDSINHYEKHLHLSGTRIAKFFLHISQDEQCRRLLKRIDRPEKNWKLSASDIHERKFWKQYRKAYEACLAATSTDYAPWHIIPADDKDNAHLIVSRIVLDTMESLPVAYPEPTKERRHELKAFREALTKELK